MIRSRTHQRFMAHIGIVLWLCLVTMPIVNAHNQPAGSWAYLCTFSGFTLVQISDSDQSASESHSTGNHCPAAHVVTYNDALNNREWYLPEGGRVANSLPHLLLTAPPFAHPLPRSPPIKLRP
ncbi:hypothetical protein NF212_17500 [Parasalinivibrio latis]|uniref:hypothetical protein n=1 Tax=Parasalinivibrio latis TaxID=2952610 RepID=UPI0030E5CD06